MKTLVCTKEHDEGREIPKLWNPQAPGWGTSKVHARIEELGVTPLEDCPGFLSLKGESEMEES
jgi:hypothetical protein